MKPTFFTSARAFRRWLDRHHATAPELLVGFHRAGVKRGMSYREALDEALAFGWIDGVRKGVDATSFTIRFSPRKAGSVWSAVNIKRVEELTAQGRMQSPGHRAFRERDERKTRQYSHEREHARLDPTLTTILRASQDAAAFFGAQPPGYRRVVTFWIMSAKKEETRLRRLAHLIERSAKGLRIDLLRPGQP